MPYSTPIFENPIEMTKLTQKLMPVLDNSKLHTFAEYRAWQDACAAFYEEQRRMEEGERSQSAKQSEFQNAYISDEEYYELARREEDAKRKAEIERAEIEAVTQAKKEAFMSSSPEQVQITETNIVSYLVSLQHWIKKGFEIDLNTIDIYPNLYGTVLHAGPRRK